jgi:Uma2 family endonuclease
MVITLKPPVINESDDTLARLSRDNPGYRVERGDDGTITMRPTHTKGGAKSLKAGVQLDRYAAIAGGKAFDSSTGFAVGPAKTVRSPDGSWVSQPRIDELVRTGTDRNFWPISPDVAIEIKSDTDAFDATVAQAKHFHERGSVYAVAVNPETREVVEFGSPPVDLKLDFDAIIDA